MAKVSLKALARNWPSPYVARNRVDEFSGGALNPKTMANMDSLGLGPTGKFYIGRKAVYPIDDLVEWMEERSSMECETQEKEVISKKQKS
jgi:hypothetical protein